MINNDDGTGLSIADVSIAEGAQGETPIMTFTVSVIPPISSAITYSWATSDDGTTNAATAGTDYVARIRNGCHNYAADAMSDTFNM